MGKAHISSDWECGGGGGRIGLGESGMWERVVRT